MSDEKKTTTPTTPSPTDLKDALAKGIADGIAAAEMVRQGSMPKAAARPDFNDACEECGQKARACKGKHKKVVVLPKDETLAPFYQGYVLNGVKYLSEHGSHFITLPEACDVEYAVQNWENQERSMRQGRKRSHNSGTVANPRIPHGTWSA